MFLKNCIENQDPSLQEIVLFFKNNDLRSISTNQIKIKKVILENLEKIQLLKSQKQNQLKIDFFIAKITKNKIKLSNIYLKFSEETLKLKNEFELLKIPQKLPESLISNQILAYASKISSYTQSPTFEYRYDLKASLPLSFRFNYADQDEIDCSWLSDRYRQNKSYKTCGIPKIKFTNNTQQNIKKQIGNKYFVQNSVYLNPIVASNYLLQFSNNKYPPKIVYTLDGTEPTKFNCVQDNQEETRMGIYVSKSTHFKFRTIQPGFIDSEVNELFIEIEEGDGDETGFQGNMERPIHEYDFGFDLSESGGTEDMFKGDNFASFNDWKNMSTPR